MGVREGVQPPRPGRTDSHELIVLLAFASPAKSACCHWGQALPAVTAQGDFHHWLSLFNRFDEILEATLKDRKDVSLDGMPEAQEPPFPSRSVLSILRVSTTILENCSNKHLNQSHEVSLTHASLSFLCVCSFYPESSALHSLMPMPICQRTELPM